jgi:TPR repeat protein
MVEFSRRLFMNRVIVAVLLAAAVLFPGCAGLREKRANDAMREGNQERSFRLWLSMAERADPKAQLRVGNMYMRGQGTAKDEDEAVRWYREAAKQDLFEAQRQLALAYLTGKGHPEDDPDAEQWLRASVENAPARSQYELAVMYLTGRVIERDPDEARRWLRKAADRWGRSRGGIVGRMREDGVLRQVAELGFAEAQLFLGDMYANGDGVPLSKEEAAKWHYLAANQGHAEAQMTLGWAFGQGKGVTKDPAEAARWFRRAAEQGHVNGQYQTGLMFRDGVGVQQSNVEAHMWFNLAAAQGHELARSMRDELAKHMTKFGRAKAEKLAVTRWLEAETEAPEEE